MYYHFYIQLKRKSTNKGLNLLRQLKIKNTFQQNNNNKTPHISASHLEPLMNVKKNTHKIALQNMRKSSKNKEKA
jgi:hypothetical protein